MLIFQDAASMPCFRCRALDVYATPLFPGCSIAEPAFIADAISAIITDMLFRYALLILFIHASDDVYIVDILLLLRFLF